MSASWHQDQQAKAKNYKPKNKKSQIPQSYGCAGDCSQPAPPPPGKETFSSGPSVPTPYVLTMVVAGALYLAIALLSKRSISR